MDKQHIKRHLLVGYIKYKRNFPHIKLALSAVFIALFLCVVLILHIIAHEMPRAWVEKIEQELSTDAFSVELDGVSLSFQNGLFLNNVSVYPKGIPHKPVINAHQVHMDVDFFSFKPLVSRIKSISIGNLELDEFSNLLPEDKLSEDIEDQPESVTILPELKDVELTCNKVSVFGIDAYNFTTLITMGDSIVNCSGIELSLTRKGENIHQYLTGDIVCDVVNNSVDFTGDGFLKTETILPLFADLGLLGLEREVGKIEFPEYPAVVNAHLKYHPNESIYNLDLHLDSKHTIYNGIDFTSVAMNLKAHGTNGWSNVDINSLTGIRPEGAMSGSLTIDLENELLSFNVNSKIRPAHMLTAIGVMKNIDQFPLAVELPCQMVANGCIGLSEESADSFKIDGNFDARSISFKGLMFENATGHVEMNRGSWDINNLQAQLFEGYLNGNICITPSYLPETIYSLEYINFAADFNCANSSLDAILNSTSIKSQQNESYQGIVNFNGYVNLDISGKEDDLHTMVGAANVEVTDAMIYRIPIFAGFTDFMARNVPGLDFILTQNSLKTELTIKDYGIHFEDLLIDGPMLSLTGHGDLWFTSHVDAHVRVNLLSQETWLGKGLHYLLFPLSKIFELQVYGPIKELTWTTSTLGLGDKTTTPEQRGEK